MKFNQKIKSLVPKKIRSNIFWGLIKFRNKVLRLIRPLTSYINSYIKVKYFLISPPKKEITAMMRVKNEEEFLMPAILSIIDSVDEFVILDNLSSDKTPEIIKNLKKRYPRKIFSYKYPHLIAKIGKESEKLANQDRNSPSHIVNFTNWCMDRCTKPYILHWAGDHIATAELHQSIKKFRKSSYQLYRSVGLNIFPDLRHSLKTIKHRKKIGAAFFLDSLESYLNEHMQPEFRIFPKRFSRYSSKDFPFLENFYSPFLKFPKYIYNDKNISHLHLKYCKKNPYQIMSKDMAKIISKNIKKGKPLEKKYIEILKKYGVNNPI